jgi:hypothetical protein
MFVEVMTGEDYENQELVCERSSEIIKQTKNV